MFFIKIVLPILILWTVLDAAPITETAEAPSADAPPATVDTGNNATDSNDSSMKHRGKRSRYGYWRGYWTWIPLPSYGYGGYHHYGYGHDYHHYGYGHDYHHYGYGHDYHHYGYYRK